MLSERSTIWATPPLLVFSAVCLVFELKIVKVVKVTRCGHFLHRVCKACESLWDSNVRWRLLHFYKKRMHGPVSINWGFQLGFYIPMKVSYSADPNVIPCEYPLCEGTSKIYLLSCYWAPSLRCWVAQKSGPFSSQIKMSPKSAVSDVGHQTFFSLIFSMYNNEN